MSKTLKVVLIVIAVSAIVIGSNALTGTSAYVAGQNSVPTPTMVPTVTLMPTYTPFPTVTPMPTPTPCPECRDWVSVYYGAIRDVCENVNIVFYMRTGMTFMDCDKLLEETYKNEWHEKLSDDWQWPPVDVEEDRQYY